MSRAVIYMEKNDQFVEFWLEVIILKTGCATSIIFLIKSMANKLQTANTRNTTSEAH